MRRFHGIGGTVATNDSGADEMNSALERGLEPPGRLHNGLDLLGITPRQETFGQERRACGRAAATACLGLGVCEQGEHRLRLDTDCAPPRSVECDREGVGQAELGSGAAVHGVERLAEDGQAGE
jgi:hypothetical protein